jgi:hypothetical protein
MSTKQSNITELATQHIKNIEQKEKPMDREQCKVLAEYAIAAEARSKALVGLLSTYLANFEEKVRSNDNINLFNGASMALSIINSDWQLLLLPHDHKQVKEVIKEWDARA